MIQQASQLENKADSDNPQDYEDVSAAYNWTEEDFENLKPKKIHCAQLLNATESQNMSCWSPVV